MSSLQIFAVPNGKQQPERLNREKKTFAFEQFLNSTILFILCIVLEVRLRWQQFLNH